MDAIFKIESRPWIQKENTKIEEFTHSWLAQDISKETLIDETNLKKKCKDYLNVDNFVMQKLRSECSDKNLNCDEEDETVIVQYSDIEEDFIKNSNLRILQQQKRHLDTYKVNRVYRKAVLLSFRYKNNYINKQPSQCSFRKNKNELCPQDSVLTVQIFRPIRRAHHLIQTPSIRYNFVLEHEFEILSSQKLFELKDAISCVADVANPNDCSNVVNEAFQISASDLYTSSFFFINNTFYNDTRDKGFQDYSRQV